MAEITAVTRDALRAAGWHPGRCIEISRMRRLIEDAGFELHGRAKRFLEEFGGLECLRPGNGPILFDPQETLNCLDADDEGVKLSRLVGRKVCPVAHECWAHFFVLDDGRVLMLNAEWHAYRMFDDEICFLNCWLDQSCSSGSTSGKIPFDLIPECHRD